MNGLIKVLFYKVFKRKYLDWDPDYSKLTANERRVMKKSEIEMLAGKFVSEEEAWGKHENG